MKKKILLLITSALALAACQPMAPERPTPENMVACPSGGSNVINIVATTAQFSVAPPHLCVTGDPNNDTDIKVIFSGNHSAGVISLAAKSGVTAPWLTASNPGTNPDQTTITVPAGTTLDTYYYTVTATGWGTIDPMITVD